MSIQKSPSPSEYLTEAAKLFRQSTKPDSIYASALFRKHLRGYHWHHDRDVKIELMPSLVLRVRDPKSGQILAQSKPGQIDQLDPVQPTDWDARNESVAQEPRP